MRFSIVLILSLCTRLCLAQTDTCYLLKVHFLYGSKPGRHYRHEEPRYFGGLHGGHVSFETGDTIFSFHHTDPVHVFAHKENRHSHIEILPLNRWMADTPEKKYITFLIPVTQQQWLLFHHIKSEYTRQTPYDYAFFGMRCASSAYDILSQLGIVKTRTRLGMILFNFYPKALRKKMMHLAQHHHYRYIAHPGDPKRTWEHR